MPLTEAGIYATALRLIDAEGVEALTMRKLAAELSANPMSLYHHVPNKEALLRGVATLAGTEFRTAATEDLPWQSRLRLLATDFRALSHHHPNLMAYSFRQPDYIQPEDPFWVELTRILEAATTPRQATRLRPLLCAIVTGVLQAELNGALQRWSTLPPASPPQSTDSSTLDPDQLWELTLDTLIALTEQQFKAAATGGAADSSS